MNLRPIDTPRKMPSKGAIASYWYRVTRICDNAWLKENIPIRIVEMNWKKPRCMGCGFSSDAWVPQYRKGTKSWLLKKTWETTYLERHHMVPVSMRGSDNLSNFVLLCYSCHTYAPYVSTRWEALDWLQKCPPFNKILYNYVSTILERMELT